MRHQVEEAQSGACTASAAASAAALEAAEAAEATMSFSTLSAAAAAEAAEAAAVTRRVINHTIDGKRNTGKSSCVGPSSSRARGEKASGTWRRMMMGSRERFFRRGRARCDSLGVASWSRSRGN